MKNKQIIYYSKSNYYCDEKINQSMTRHQNFHVKTLKTLQYRGKNHETKPIETSTINYNGYTNVLSK